MNSFPKGILLLAMGLLALTAVAPAFHKQTARLPADLTPGPDYIVQYFKVDPSPVDYKLDFYLNLKVANVGDIAATYPTSVNLKIDQDFDGTWDIIAATLPSVKLLNAGYSQFFSWKNLTDFTWPNAPIGTHRARACVLSMPDEAQTNNNCSQLIFDILPRSLSSSSSSSSSKSSSSSSSLAIVIPQRCTDGLIWCPPRRMCIRPWMDLCP